MFIFRKFSLYSVSIVVRLNVQMVNYINLLHHNLLKPEMATLSFFFYSYLAAVFVPQTILKPYIILLYF